MLGRSGELMMGDIAPLQSQTRFWGGRNPCLFSIIGGFWGFEGRVSKSPREGGGSGMLTHVDDAAVGVLEFCRVMKIPEELKARADG